MPILQCSSLHYHMSCVVISSLFLFRYMKRRCEFLDCLPAFNYNNGAGVYKTNELGMKYTTNTKQLGSTLMNTMLKEVSDFCDPSIKENWSLKAHQQVVSVSLLMSHDVTVLFISWSTTSENMKQVVLDSYHFTLTNLKKLRR